MRLITFVAAMFAAGAALADPQAIRFAPGASSGTVTGTVSGYDMTSYTVNARAGQVMRYEIDSSAPHAYVNVWAPGADEALSIGATVGDSGEFVLPVSGDYRLDVYQMRNSARRGDQVPFTLKVTVLPDRAVAQSVPAAPTTGAGVIRFAAGASSGTVSGVIVGAGQTLYTLNARAGQQMALALQSPGTGTFVNVYAPGDMPGAAEPFIDGSLGEGQAPVLLPESGDYTLQVMQTRNAARNEAAMPYSLTVSVTGAAAAAAGQARVIGVNTTLNLRAAPSTQAAVVGNLRNGEMLRLGGCEMARSHRWCEVVTASGQAGWVAAEYLDEN